MNERAEDYESSEDNYFMPEGMEVLFNQDLGHGSVLVRGMDARRRELQEGAASAAKRLRDGGDDDVQICDQFSTENDTTLTRNVAHRQRVGDRPGFQTTTSTTPASRLEKRCLRDALLTWCTASRHCRGTARKPSSTMPSCRVQAKSESSATVPRSSPVTLCSPARSCRQAPGSSGALFVTASRKVLPSTCSSSTRWTPAFAFDPKGQ